MPGNGPAERAREEHHETHEWNETCERSMYFFVTFVLFACFVVLFSCLRNILLRLLPLLFVKAIPLMRF
jgi:hypothetical protein